MYLDADRDGAIDAAPVNNPVWQAGAGNLGAVIMVNTRQYGAGNPVPARMEVQFRWDNGGIDPGAWQATLTLNHPNRVAIYPDPLQGTAAVVPAAIAGGGRINLHQAPFQALLNAGQLSLWIEAANFPAAPAANSVLLTFQFTASNGMVITQPAELRIAPWIMASDLDPMSTVWFISAAPPNPMQQQIQNFLPAGVAASTRQPPAIQGAGYKPFMRDVMRCGWVKAPHHQDIAILERLDAGSVYNGLATQVAGAGILTNATTGIPATQGAGQSSQDNGGNMLVTPPTAQFPFGRIVYGANLPNFPCHAANFFAAQGEQTPLVVDSSWLNVGHADEFISFVPDPGNPAWPYKILLASPRLGYILTHAASATPNALNLGALITLADATNAASRALEVAPGAGPGWPILQGQIAANFAPLAVAAGGAPAAPGGYLANPAPPVNQNGKVVWWQAGPAYAAQDIGAYLANPGPPTHQTLYQFSQPRIDAARQTLLNGLGNGAALGGQYVIDIPILPSYSGGLCATDSADSVNMLILGNDCLVPKPFGPVCANTYLFEHYIQTKLQALGMNVTFLNDWEAFHIREGEIHCGTNQIPQPLPPGREWWI